MNDLNNENPITEFELTDLLSIVGKKAEGMMSKCIADDKESHLQAFRFPCRIDAFIIGVGTEGETEVTFNLHSCPLKRNTLFLFGANNIIQNKSNTSFKAHVVAISSELTHQLNIDIKNLVPVLLKFSQRPCFEIDEEDAEILRKYVTIIREEVMHSDDHQYPQEVLLGLLTALLYKVGDILYRYLKLHPELDNPVKDRTEAYFRMFMQLLGQNYRQERSVSFYAQQLCITPKYLTTLIKRVSGQSVSEWIDRYVILEAKTLLKHSHMSIQEIAYYLNFPNQSFFGSYFKRNTGMSPTQYKEQR